MSGAVRKGIILAAGLGKRLRPLTYYVPKEMLKVQGKPLLEHAITMMKLGDIKKILIVICPEKENIIKSYFGSGKEFGVNLRYVIQKQPTGTASAVYLGRDFVNKDDFVVMFGDNLFEPKNFIRKLIDFHKLKKSEATLVLVRVKKANEFGVVKLDKNGRILSMIEKPSASKARAYKVNNKYLAMTGLLVLKPDIFQYIKRTPIGKYGERWLTDAIEKMRQEGADVYGYVFSGKWVDIGSKAFLDHLIFDLKHSPDIPSP
jgi:dTDP-glucose pyrophosphorylase